MENLLAIRNLRVDFYLNRQVINAVDGADLDIAKDEIVVLAGESGSGKTITALSITKIIPSNAKISAGSINFAGRELLEIDEPVLARIRGKEIAYIFQEPTSFLNPVYSIGDQIVETLIVHQNMGRAKAYKRAVELLDLVKIRQPERVVFDYPHQLSGGMNQRVFIAMALACKPKLLIADEPTTSLDIIVESQILRLLLEIKKEIGFSLLFITHNLAIAKRIADRIYIMYRGRIVEGGIKEIIFDLPKHPHTKRLIQAYNKIGRI
ncbi:MAG: ABC transporter ATP-binding protein [Candidatus Omnitrophota bacterium]